MAYRTRLPGPQAGTWARALRGPRLAWLPPSRHALHRRLWLPGRRTGEDSPLGMGHTEAHGDWPSPRRSTPKRLRSDRSGTSRTQSQPCAGGSPWPWPGVSSDVRAAQPASTSQIITPVHDAVRLGEVKSVLAGSRLLRAAGRTRSTARSWSFAPNLGAIKTFSSSNCQITIAPNIRLSADLGGGPVGDVGIYSINAARYITGEEPVEVTA